jgi:hypothetical protein
MRAIPLHLPMLVLLAGCAQLPHITHRPVVRNPFPQLTRVAVAPFFNLSAEPAVNGRQVALAYFNELQSIAGFEVVPIGIVESKMLECGLSLGKAEDARKLAQLLEVDAVVVGAVTDYSPYYPPRCALRVEWYAANPCFHPIPPGYGLPWGEPQAEEIPEPLVYETSLAIARSQSAAPSPPLLPHAPLEPAPETLPELLPVPSDDGTSPASLPDVSVAHARGAPYSPAPALLPPASTLPCLPTDQPVLRHTRTYNGHDFEVTQRLKEYAYYRDEARAGGWEAYLQRSDDFLRFCCHLHLAEMLTARGGAAESQVVWRWPKCR